MITASAESLTIEPAPTSWDGLIRKGALTDVQHRLRKQLGLPTDRPIVMTGHQAELWHPGILAKYLAAEAVAERTGARTAWLVADQDAGNPAVAAYPTTNADGHTVLAEVDLAEPGSASSDIPTGLQPPIEIAADVPLALQAAAAAMRGRADESSAANQLAGALSDLLEPVLEPAPTAFALDLRQTDLFAEVIDRMRRDPAQCIEVYNASVAAEPHAHVSPLSPGELPLWRVEHGQPRRRVTAGDIDSLKIEDLAPRALLMTGLMQLGACDLFIHGTGGGRYVRAGDRWLIDWLGRDATATLAPTAVVTATRLLELPGGEVTPDQAGRAATDLHRALNSPAATGDATLEADKQALLLEIQSLKSSGNSPAAAFARLRELIAEHRARNGDALEAFESKAADLQARAGDAELASKRDWPFVLYPPEALADLRRQVRAAFGLSA